MIGASIGKFDGQKHTRTRVEGRCVSEIEKKADEAAATSIVFDWGEKWFRVNNEWVVWSIGG